MFERESPKYLNAVESADSGEAILQFANPMGSDKVRIFPMLKF
jgi:hypothetical protein